MKVYAIGKGCYSAFRIVAVITNEQRAKDYCQMFDDDYSFEEFELDGPLENERFVETHKGMKPYTGHVSIKKSEHHFSGGKAARRFGLGDYCQIDKKLESDKFFIYGDEYVTHFWARDKEHAMKILTDRFYAAEALNALPLTAAEKVAQAEALEPILKAKNKLKRRQADAWKKP